MAEGWKVEDSDTGAEVFFDTEEDADKYLEAAKDSHRRGGQHHQVDYPDPKDLSKSSFELRYQVVTHNGEAVVKGVDEGKANEEAQRLTRETGEGVAREAVALREDADHDGLKLRYAVEPMPAAESYHFDKHEEVEA